MFEETLREAVLKARESTPEMIEGFLQEARKNREVQLLGAVVHNRGTIKQSRDLCELIGVDYVNPSKSDDFINGVAYYLAAEYHITL